MVTMLYPCSECNILSSSSTCWCTSSWSIWVRYSSPGGQPGIVSCGADIHCTGCCGAGVGGREVREGGGEGGRGRGRRTGEVKDDAEVEELRERVEGVQGEVVR